MIGRMGFLDRWIQTPSNHRVHHAQNDIYLDKNYVGVFLIWDHLFGSFQEELRRGALHLRDTRPAQELESGVGQSALLLGHGQGLLARGILAGQNEGVVRASGLAAGGCGGSFSETGL